MVVLLVPVVILSFSADRYRSAFNTVAAIVKEGLPAEGSENGNIVRLWIWDSAWSVIKEKPFLGSGTDRSEDLLLDEYFSRNMGMASSMRYNAHNQFLETWIGVGIIGLAPLLILFSVLLRTALKSRNKLFLSFALIVISQSLFESFLERFSGVIFFILFYIIFEPLSNEKRIREDESPGISPETKLI